ncbi:sugar phosphate nucleotidyltransferase [Paenibacillus humicola]|uniref:sugar phosphate nucleotidyltransferase n=1 Tax=Paenibacillus humicola TaxID=3110540 RepID=UPI00237C3095|nr:sugar phosphate nucleotidyltransferase [Paenibacillus humicola]
MKAVIMAGGKGTRLRPLTCDLPKPMVPLLNKPCMAYIIELLRKHGIKEIAVTTQYLPEAIAGYFGDGADYGVRLVYFDETEPLGTAGSVRNAASFLDERFIVISGDALTDIDLTEARRFHEEREAAATMVLSRASMPVEFGVVLTEPDGKITRFLEKPDWSEVFSDTVNTGIYILEPELLELIPEGAAYDFSKELFPRLLTAGAPLYGYVTDRYWSDIGSIEQYKTTQFDMLDGKVRLELDGQPIAPGVFAAAGASIHPASRIVGPAYIGPEAHVGDGAVIGPYAIVGASSRIEGGSVVGRSILWREARIGRGAELDGSLLCNHTSLMAGARCEPESVVGSHCVIGRKAAVRSHVKLWPKKRVQDEAHVTGTLVWGETAPARLFGEWGAEGAAGVEMTPEFVSRFGAAFGSQLSPGSGILVGASQHEFASLLKDALIPALRSVGIDCIDCGAVPAEALRAHVPEAGLVGALHVLYTPLADSGLIRIECSDRSGLPIDKAAERKIEQALRHDDFRRPRPDAAGRLIPADGGAILEAYARRFGEAVGWDGHARLGRLAIAADEWVYANAEALLRPGADEIVRSGPAYDLTALARTEADLHIALDNGGREWTALGADGAPLGGEELLLAALLAAFHRRPGVVLGLPVYAPAAADSIAEGLGGRVVRAKRTPRELLAAGGDPLFHPLTSGIYAAAGVMRHMAATGLAPEQMLAPIAKPYRRHAAVACPWEIKGSALRQMADGLAAAAGPVEMTDGLKISEEQGTIWIWPDADAPTLRIIAESVSAETAADLLGRYVSDVKRVLN